MEPARPVVDRMVLDFIRRHTFDKDSCYETREGLCLLDPDLTASITPWMARLRLSVGPVARQVAQLSR